MNVSAPGEINNLFTDSSFKTLWHLSYFLKYTTYVISARIVNFSEKNMGTPE